MRYKKILVYGQALVNMQIQNQESHIKCISGLPEGTKFCYSIPDTLYGIWIVVEHESFPLLKEGEIIPILKPSLFTVG